MGEEMRAFNNLNWCRASLPHTLVSDSASESNPLSLVRYRATGDKPKSLIGLNGYGPNLNIARDPRYGRTSEAQYPLSNPIAYPEPLLIPQIPLWVLLYHNPTFPSHKS